MSSHFFRLGALVTALCLAAAWAPASATAADKTAADLLPASIVGYLEIRQPGKTLDVILDHPLALELQKQPPYQQALQSPQYEQVRAAVKRVEDQLGLPWRQAASGLTSGGLYVGFDLPSQGVVALAQAADEKVAEKALAIALDLVRSMAAGGGQPDPVKQDEHRDVKIYAVGDAHFAVCGKWIITTNKRHQHGRAASNQAEILWIDQSTGWHVINRDNPLLTLEDRVGRLIEHPRSKHFALFWSEVTGRVSQHETAVRAEHPE